MMEKRKISRWWWERRERSRESTVVRHCFVGVKDCYVRGEAGSRVHWDLHHTCWCADHGQWPHPCAGLDIAAVWVCQPRTDSLEESEGSPFLAENPRSLQSHLETCEGHESYSLFCYRALKVDGRWNRFIFWLFHSSTKAAFYLCLRELSNLHSHTVLSLFSFIFPGLSYYRVSKIQYPTKSVQAQRSGDTCSMRRLMGMSVLRGKGCGSLDQQCKPRLKPLSLQVLSAGCRVIKMSYLS